MRLLSVEKPQARAFYESEAIRGGWSVRQLDRQISTQFYKRAVRSKRPDTPTSPVGIILCSDQDDAVVKYATGGIRTRVFASKYLTSLPTEETLRQEIVTTQRAIRARWKEEK